MAEDFLIGVGKDNRNVPSNNSNNSSQKPPNPPKKGNDGGYDKAANNKTRLKGCGFGCLGIIVLFTIIFYFVGSKIESAEANDLRITYLKQDMKRLTSNLTEKDSLSQFVKMCLDIGVSEENELNKDAFKYFTRRNGNKLLIIVEIRDMQDIEASTRKGIIEIIEECLDYQDDGENTIDEYYICVEGKWNTLLVKTPNGSDLGGKFANDQLLLPFYNEYVKDSLPSLD
ncbi:hypothetical protein [Kordia sp.]|uniref:hypothetical protein n=1 Tax=Kordia sp. TaxID=1965332 RepID=UPI003B5CB4B7